MKHLLGIFLFIPMLVTLVSSGCCKQSELHNYDSDSINVYARLSPNEEWISSKHTYGPDSVVGSRIKYRVATDSTQIYMDFDVTILELHPAVTADILNFIHYELSNQCFVSEADTIEPFSIRELTEQGTSQRDIVRKALDFESQSFLSAVTDVMADGYGFNMDIDIHPVFLNDKFVTYSMYAYYYTGGMHGNYTQFLQTYDLSTGKCVRLEDIVESSKMDKLRESVVEHMAVKYPIYSTVNSVESYLDSLNRWKGAVDIGVFMGITQEEDLERITVRNYPLDDPGIHEAGLVFSWEKYQLTPGCDGCPTILLTFDEIRDCLKEPFSHYVTDSTKLSYDTPDYGEYVSKTELDSIRKAWSPADDGGDWPRDIYDWYKFRYGEISRYYPLQQIIGSWIGYGHLYDPRHLLTIREDGSFSCVSEEALAENKQGEMEYVYYSTINGRYEYDSKHNKLNLKNYLNIDLNTHTVEAYVKELHPENKYMIVHSIVGDTIMMADQDGDLWPYIRIRNER